MRNFNPLFIPFALSLILLALCAFGILKPSKKVKISLLPPLLDMQVCKINKMSTFEGPGAKHYLICASTGKNPKSTFFSVDEFNQQKQNFYFIDRYEYKKLNNYVKQVEGLK